MNNDPSSKDLDLSRYRPRFIALAIALAGYALGCALAYYNFPFGIADGGSTGNEWLFLIGIGTGWLSIFVALFAVIDVFVVYLLRRRHQRRNKEASSQATYSADSTPH